MTFDEAISLIAHSAPMMEGPPTPEMRDAAALYATASKQANDRLAKCESLLAAHQRSEALRLAAIEPDLLRTCGKLDVATRGTWTYYCSNHSLPLALELNRVASAALNAAFAAEMRLEKELQHHRMLALARAPLKPRLEMLRVLERAEPNNIGWREDLASYEAARFEEIRHEYRQARTANDKEQIKLLVREINVPQVWRSPVPLDLLEGISRDADEARQREVANAVKKLKHRFDDAIRNDLLEDALAVEESIPKVQRQLNIPDGDAALAPLSVGIVWIERETKKRKLYKKYDKACADLRQAVSHHFEWASVQQAYEFVASFNLPIPQDIERHYRSRLQRLWIVRGLIAGAIVFVMVGVIVWQVVPK